MQAGSTSVQPLSQELADAFMDVHSKVVVDIQGGGSGQGVKAVEEDLVDFGALSRELKAEEEAIIKNSWVIAKDGIAIIVNKKNPITDVKSSVLMSLYFKEGSTSGANCLAGASHVVGKRPNSWNKLVEANA